MTTPLAYEYQQPEVGPVVYLYALDLQPIGGGGVLRFTENTVISGTSRTIVKYGGLTYFPLDVDSSGWEVSGEGKLPRPKIKYNNTDFTLLSYINTYDDLIGAHVYRIQTLSKYLDGQPEADDTKQNVEKWIIERKTAQNKSYVEFELASIMDLEGKKVPGRVFIRSTCMRPYYYYSGGVWKQAPLSFRCPYRPDLLGVYFKDDRTPTNEPSEDKCGKRLTDCEKRAVPAGWTALPFGGFPGVGRGVR